MGYNIYDKIKKHKIVSKRNYTMKKTMQIICCALGSGMIGYFANQLNTVVGSMLFILGIVMLVISIAMISRT